MKQTNEFFRRLVVDWPEGDDNLIRTRDEKSLGEADQLIVEFLYVELGGSTKGSR
jgi:hypothetical protein